MKKQLALFVLTVALGVVGFIAAGVAVAATQTPPGQGECQHGNSGKPCGDDPQPDNGKDCQAHGNNGGVNEDHCAPVETTTETTTQGTTTQGTTTTQATTTESPGGQTTPTVTPTLDAGSTTSAETTATPSSTSNDEDDSAGDTATAPIRSSAASSAGKAKAAPKRHATLGASAVAPKPTRQPQEAPFTL